MAAGTVTLRNDTATGNSAQGGADGSGQGGTAAGLARGGGLYIGPGVIVSLDAFTLAHTQSNKPDDIYGSYALIT